MYYGTMKINKAEQKQDEFDAVLNALSKYSPKDQKYVEAKNVFTMGEKNY